MGDEADYGGGGGDPGEGAVGAPGEDVWGSGADVDAYVYAGHDVEEV